MIKALIFDCFGVLIVDAMSVMLTELRQSNPAKADKVLELINASNRGVMDKLAARTAIAEQFDLALDIYIQAISSGEARNQPLLDFIAAQRDTYKTAVLSNVSQGGLSTRFPNEELRRYFDVIVESGAIGYAKPDIEAYELTAKALGVELDECVMIDDRAEYCRGAQAAGMQAILYQTFAQMKQDLSELKGQHTLAP
jgi:HAD superfamily hydrolase (TIGR01509 family)